MRYAQFKAKNTVKPHRNHFRLITIGLIRCKMTSRSCTPHAGTSIKHMAIKGLKVIASQM